MALINLALSADGRAANGHRLTFHEDKCDFEADPVNPNLLNVCKTISFENKNGEQGSLILRIQKIPSEDEVLCLLGLTYLSCYTNFQSRMAKTLFVTTPIGIAQHLGSNLPIVWQWNHRKITGTAGLKCIINYGH